MLIQIPNPVQAGEINSPHQKQAGSEHQLGRPRIQLSSDTYLPGNSIRFHRSRIQFHETLLSLLLSRAVANPGYTCGSNDLSLNFRHQSQAEVVKYISNLLAINQVPMALV